jgi:hypothetical protein
VTGLNQLVLHVLVDMILRGGMVDILLSENRDVDIVFTVSRSLFVCFIFLSRRL